MNSKQQRKEDIKRRIEASWLAERSLFAVGAKIQFAVFLKLKK